MNATRRRLWILVLALLAGGPQALAQNPTAKAAPGARITSIGVHAFVVSDNDGGRPARIGGAEIGEFLDFASRAFAAGGIRFRFDPETDVSPLRSTLINNTMGVEPSDWLEVKRTANAIARSHPGKLVIFFRHGPGPSPTGFSFSWFDYDFVVCADLEGIAGRYWFLAHEIGHYFGLPHPHGGPREFPTLSEAEAFFLEKKRDPNVFDGDGLADTPPIPPIIEAYSRDDLPRVMLGGMAFRLVRGNVPSYYHFTRPELDLQGELFTAGQRERVRWILDLRRRGRMSIPNHAILKNVIEAETLPILATRGPATSVQDMKPFFIGSWSSDAQLFGGGARGSGVTLSLPAVNPGRYGLALGFTYAPDYGIIRASIDGQKLGEFNSYGSVVLPAELAEFGPLSLTAGAHTLSLDVVGHDPASRGDRFGLDCLVVKPWAATRPTNRPRSRRPAS